MKTIVIKENSKQAKALIEMLKTFDFVEFIEGLGKPSVAKTKAPNKLMQELEQALQEVKLSRQGKLKLKTLDQLLNEK